MKPYRNRKLLNIAKECPNCMCCGRHNDGTVVAAHSNQMRDAKALGRKSHDFRVAYMCDACHYLVDDGPQSREQKISIWEEAHRATIGWLFLTGRITVK